MSEEVKNLEMRVDQKFKVFNDQLGDLKDDFKEHKKEHGQEHVGINSTLTEANQRIAIMETVIPDLKEATSGLIQAIQGLNKQMVEQAVYTKQNTEFRMKFTWKEILALSLMVIALINAFGGKI